MSENEVYVGKEKEDNGKADELVHISREDRLEAENLHLRVLNLAHELTSLQNEINVKRGRINELQKQILARRSEIEKKYNIDLNTHEIRDEDGAVLPRGQAGVGVQQQLTAMQARG